MMEEESSIKPVSEPTINSDVENNVETTVVKHTNITSVKIGTILAETVDKINNKLNDQDFNQKVTVSITVILELYRVLVSSFLVLFVPQKCGDHVCSLSENMVFENHLYNAGLVFNFITMAAFLAMYTFEIKRENRLITYLEVNKSVASDNNSVGLALEKLPVEKRNSIWQLDKYYIYSGWTSIVMFIINTILSGFVVYEYYLDSQTTSTYITNILFMITKLADVHSNVNTEKNVFYSAYMKGKIQYNDVDPNKIIEYENVVIDEDKMETGVSPPVKTDNNISDNVKYSISDSSDSSESSKSSESSDTNSNSENQEHEKIIVTIHDINSPKSSSNDLQSLNENQ